MLTEVPKENISRLRICLKEKARNIRDHAFALPKSTKTCKNVARFPNQTKYRSFYSMFSQITSSAKQELDQKKDKLPKQTWQSFYQSDLVIEKIKTQQKPIRYNASILTVRKIQPNQEDPIRSRSLKSKKSSKIYKGNSLSKNPTQELRQEQKKMITEGCFPQKEDDEKFQPIGKIKTQTYKHHQLSIFGEETSEKIFTLSSKKQKRKVFQNSEQQSRDEQELVSNPLMLRSMVSQRKTVTNGFWSKQQLKGQGKEKSSYLSPW